jgi:hypothetical protein
VIAEMQVVLVGVNYLHQTCSPQRHKGTKKGKQG